MPPGHIDAGATGFTQIDGTPIPDEFMDDEDRAKLTDILEISKAVTGRRAGDFGRRLNLPKVGMVQPRTVPGGPEGA